MVAICDDLCRYWPSLENANHIVGKIYWFRFSNCLSKCFFNAIFHVNSNNRSECSGCPTRKILCHIIFFVSIPSRHSGITFVTVMTRLCASTFEYPGILNRRFCFLNPSVNTFVTAHRSLVFVQSIFVSNIPFNVNTTFYEISSTCVLKLKKMESRYAMLIIRSVGHILVNKKTNLLYKLTHWISQLTETGIRHRCTR